MGGGGAELSQTPKLPGSQVVDLEMHSPNRDGACMRSTLKMLTPRGGGQSGGQEGPCPTKVPGAYN